MSNETKSRVYLVTVLTNSRRTKRLASNPNAQPNRPDQDGQQTLDVRLQRASGSVQEEEGEDDDIASGEESVFTVLREGEEVTGRVGGCDSVGEGFHYLQASRITYYCVSHGRSVGGQELWLTHKGRQGQTPGRPSRDDLGNLRHLQNPTSYHHPETKT